MRQRFDYAFFWPTLLVTLRQRYGCADIFATPRYDEYYFILRAALFSIYAILRRVAMLLLRCHCLP